MCGLIKMHLQHRLTHCVAQSGTMTQPQGRLKGTGTAGTPPPTHKKSAALKKNKNPK